MTEETGRLGLTPESICALAREAGVTEDQVREIVLFVGIDRASILREAREIREANKMARPKKKP